MTDWQEIHHAGRRWAFSGDELARWDEEEGEFHFTVYHGLTDPTAETVAAFIDTLETYPPED
jgi:hypothetical protein